MFVHLLTQLSLGLSYTRLSMSGMASFGCTKSCFSVLCGLSTVLTWSPSKTLLKGSGTPLTNIMTPLTYIMGANRCLWFLSDCGTWGMGVLTLWWMNLLGCPLFNRTFITRPFSFSNKCRQVLGRRINGCQPLCRSVRTTAASDPTPA